MVAVTAVRGQGRSVTRACEACGSTPAKKAVCCGQKLCEVHAASVTLHDCPTAKKLDAIASDPKKRKAWLQERAPEEQLTTDVIDALNRIPGVEVRRAKRKQGARASDENDGVPDVVGDAGVAIYVETKRQHADECGCESCAAQRDFARRARARGAIVVLGVRSVAQAVQGVQDALRALVHPSGRTYTADVQPSTSPERKA